MLSPKMQFQTQKASLIIMIIGALVTGIYFWFYFPFSLWYKIVMAINTVAVMAFMGANLAGIIQQYKQYEAQIEAQKELAKIQGIEFKEPSQPELNENQIRSIRKWFCRSLFVLGSAIILFVAYLIKNSAETHTFYKGNLILDVLLTALGVWAIWKSVKVHNQTEKFIKNKFYNVKGGLK